MTSDQERRMAAAGMHVNPQFVQVPLDSQEHQSLLARAYDFLAGCEHEAEVQAAKIAELGRKFALATEALQHIIDPVVNRPCCFKVQAHERSMYQHILGVASDALAELSTELVETSDG